MKNYSRIYGILMILIIGIFIFFEITSLSLNFQLSLENEKELNETANLRFSIMLKDTVDMLNEPNADIDQELITYLCDSIYRGMENQKVIYLVYDSKKSLYASRLFNNKMDDLSNYNNLDYLYTEYFTSGERRYMQTTSGIDVSGNSIYVRTLLDISDSYAEREILLNRYRLIVVAVFALLAVGLYLITSTFEKTIRLSEKMKQIEAASKRQEEFSASFAHECKTPLTSIIGYSDMLRVMDLSEEERKDAAEYIFSQGKRLQRLTKQMMMLSNLSEGVVANEEVKVTQLVENILKMASSQNKKKNIQVLHTIEDGIILGESDLYQSMLINILDNARKACNDHGKIEFVGKNKANYYQLTITDNGCGMDVQTMNKMTQPFYMANKARTRQEGGAGLGMTIVNKIANELKVKLEVQSELGKGTTMTLLIPKV